MSGSTMKTTLHSADGDFLWAMAYGHSSGLPPWEAVSMIAEKRKHLLCFLFLLMAASCTKL